MGTRGHVAFLDTENNELAVTYHQYDSYPTGLGQKLKDWLKEKIIVNGISRGQDNDTYANGMGCLAAQWIDYIKEGIGAVYMASPNQLEQGHVSYEYELRIDDLPGLGEEIEGSNINLICRSMFGESEEFEGTVEEFVPESF